eukprot:s163_g38.t1
MGPVQNTEIELGSLTVGCLSFKGRFSVTSVQEMLISSIGQGQRMAVQRACKWLETQGAKIEHFQLFRAAMTLAMKRRVTYAVFATSVFVVTFLSGLGEHAKWNREKFAFLGLVCGLSLVVLHVPNSGVERHVPFHRRLVGFFLVSLTTVYVVSYPWHLTPQICNITDTRMFDRRWINVATTSLLALLFFACLFKPHPPSACAHDAKWCVFGTGDGDHMADALKDFSLCMALGMEAVVNGWTIAAFQCRMSALKVSSTKLPCRSLLQDLAQVRIMSLSLVGNCLCSAIRRSVDTVWTQILNSLWLRICFSIFLAIWTTYSVKICSVLSKGLQILVLEAKRVKGLPRRQTIWAARVLRLELVLCAIVGFTTFFSWLLVLGIRTFQLAWPDGYKIYARRLAVEVERLNGEGHLWFHVGWFRRFDLVGNAFGLALLSGILWQGEPPGMDQEEEQMESRSATRTCSRLSDGLQYEEIAVYDAKVKELASRGVTLRSLLRFWEQLLEHEIMPSFDPRLSTTNDVVRQAIIPLTRQGRGGCAMATLWSAHTEIVPTTMVTHNWSNYFGHLVAAILADALGKDTYVSIADQLTSKKGLHSVMMQLNGETKLEQTYWICALSVNQHASICGGFGPEPDWQNDPEKWKSWDRSHYDSVSHTAFPVCSCEEPKHFNASAACELNKFDDMMGELDQRDIGFGQLVVVDEHFEVLNRAWCIAEIVEGNTLAAEGIGLGRHFRLSAEKCIRVNVHSQNSVDVHYDSLAVLDVKQCQATSESDRNFILSKIKDKEEARCLEEAFNVRLQNLIFSSQGLFKPWVDVRERTRRVGLIWRRCAVLAGKDTFDADLPNHHFRTMFSKLEDESDGDEA